MTEPLNDRFANLSTLRFFHGLVSTLLWFIVLIDTFEECDICYARKRKHFLKKLKSTCTRKFISWDKNITQKQTEIHKDVYKVYSSKIYI